ncbi:MAG: hypothetical protein KDE68_05785 [Rhodocyclaceae bacterium]|nr:hypothetical protein [Rhodocyclaceae bacterium]
MPQRHLLYLDANAMRCHRWQHGKVTEEARFATTDEGITGFARYVQQHTGGLFTLLVDQVEESFQLDSLPYVRGPDREAMLTRKRTQAFFGSSLSGALSLGRESGGRRDERFLFVALTRQAALDPWLQALRVANAPLTGVFSPALLIDRLVKRLAADTPRCLLVSFAPGGMRQTFIDNGRLRFSRLAQSLHDVGSAKPAHCAAEILKTHSYLTGQRMIPRDTRLPVHLLVDSATFGRLRGGLADSDTLHYLHTPLQQLAHKIGLNSEVRGGDALPALLHWMARNPGTLQLAPPAERRYYRLWQTRQTLLGGALAVFAGAVLFAAKLALGSYQLNQETLKLQATSAAQNAQLNRLMSALPALPVPLNVLQPAMDTLDTLRRQTASPRPWLSHLSAALDAHPALTLRDLRWQVLDDPAAQTPPGSVMGHARLSLPETIAGDRRAMLDSAQDFLAELSRPPGHSVRLTRQPVELAPDRAFRSASQNAAPSEGADFEVSFGLRGGAP